MLPPPPPLAQARPRSKKSGQNGGSTPTLCLDKAVHACDTRDSKARAGLEPYTKHGTMHKQPSNCEWGRALYQKRHCAQSPSHSACTSMDVVVPMTRGTKIVAGTCSPVLRTYVTAVPGITLLAMAGNHIRTNSMGFQYVVQCCCEHNALSQTWVSPPFPVQALDKHPILHSGPQKQRSQNFLKMAVQRPPRA